MFTRFNIIYIIFSIQLSFCLEFTFQNKSISALIDGVLIEQPFLGGTNRPRIQWLDWDNDGDIDLFLQDEDNNLRYYENLGDSFTYDYYLITTNFQNLILGNWFIIQDFDGDGYKPVHSTQIETSVYF
jgi:hypothetical protein